ncbi:glycosyltransferase [Nakamurella multipartita]|uniref:UDP-glucuronosyl/UDP-glucosyltransferase n=1 Tax=Nakamurella multipartita (strain ATCC 700099 / DSM 44233 / CIP 104796 / JCM 9543 / NBRC 105858 / Y-104) TaxID=479431 RepID=C8X7J3_NAKMY|nr:nucleotide disphospho-sugar-binding domain-containing protein [Nakamurella multipartita]ACV78946.1 UDP-glucuronosyl/UDP-glucosyltransferase [Nakamurella multipartita DSM 44233]
MKILFASMPADGHFNPLTGVAEHLARAGHDVRWYAGPAYGAKLDRLGMRHFPYRRATEVTGGNIHRLYPERAALKGPKLIAFDLEKYFVTNVDQHFQDIVEIRSEFAFDVFFCDGAMYVEKLIAEVLQIPVLATGISAVLPGDGGPPPFFGLRPARTVIGRTTHAVVRRMLTSTMRPGVTTYNEILAGYGIAPLPPDGFPHLPMASARRLLLDGTPGLEFPGYRSPANAEFVGPLVPARAALGPGPEATLPPQVLEPGAPVVVVSQGTVDNADQDKLLVPTLTALSDQPYVVVATTGGVGTERLRKRFPAPNVVIEDFVNYTDLFPHADVFVTSGGYGSTVAALRHGVRVVGAGKREGKNDINARIGYNKLGIDLRTERPRPARIRAAVHRVLHDPEIDAGVAGISAEFESYHPMVAIESALRDLTPAAGPRDPVRRRDSLPSRAFQAELHDGQR